MRLLVGAAERGGRAAADGWVACPESGAPLLAAGRADDENTPEPVGCTGTEGGTDSDSESDETDMKQSMVPKILQIKYKSGSEYVRMVKLTILFYEIRQKRPTNIKRLAEPITAKAYHSSSNSSKRIGKVSQNG